jgi:hypothetical protein
VRSCRRNDTDYDVLDGRYASGELGVLESLLYDQLEFFYAEINLDNFMAVEVICDHH